MAVPSLHYRGDIIVMAAWAAATPLVFTNFCGADGVTLTIDNAIQETQVGDCDDWTLPIQTQLAYGAQSVSMTVNAQLAKSNRDKLLRWSKDQLVVPIRIHIVDAPTGEVEYIDGEGMLPSLGVEGIANTDGSVIRISLNIRFKDGVEFTNASA
ncbi:hypothetical protein ACEUZ9_000155 [Paracoccus litorisediminis]|uniref:hypothetical protein n=1 Tax=Paracoccus litorisediminis TaxID=2006130 RepID=UPI003731CD6C